MGSGRHPLNPTSHDAEGVLTHSFIRTASGRVVWIENPEAALETHAICVEDLAHACALSCRYNGHTRVFYSIAQHECIVHDLAEDRDKGWALFHDAPEAYMGDLVSPLKRNIRDVWKPLEHRWEAVIRKKFRLWPWENIFAGTVYNGLVEAQERRIKALDILVLGREMIDLMPFGEEDQKHLGYLDERRPTDIDPIEPWSPARARDEFMARFHSLAQGG